MMYVNPPDLRKMQKDLEPIHPPTVATFRCDRIVTSSHKDRLLAKSPR